MAHALSDAALPPFLTAALWHLEPALNRYRRYYFLSCDGKFRLTVDCCLEFAAVPTAHRPAIHLSPPAKSLILELKFAPDAAQNTDLITNALPFRVARFSKYVAGIDRL